MPKSATATSRDNASHRKLSRPVTKPKDSKGTKSPHQTEARQNTFETLCALLPLAVPFSAQVKAEILSPSRRTGRPERPRQRKTTNGSVAPMNSEQFWFHKSTQNSIPSRDTLMPPTHCGSCSLLSLAGIPNKIPTPDRDASNLMTYSSVRAAKDRNGRAKESSSTAMAHSIARHRRIALLAGTPSLKLAFLRRPYMVPKST